jgi:4-hydroxythreonine-4-phosphate dehydrogenase
VTLGDPGGVGPELLVRVVTEELLPAGVELLVLGGEEWLHELAEQADHNWLPELHTRPPGECVSGRVIVMPLEGVPWVRPRPGRADPALFPFVRAALERGVELVMDGTCDALVTNPIVKAALQTATETWPGQTQFVAHRARSRVNQAAVWPFFQSDPPVMAMVSERLRVTLVTDHLPLARVAAAVTSERLEAVLRVTDTAGPLLGLPRPRIAVCGLNPHAGEGGLLGEEEAGVHEPVLARLRSAGLRVVGPLAGDTAFARALRGEFDLVCAMFHDQGLAPFKAVSFGQGVNVTLGIPMIRTSVDHGTAFELAGTFRADPGSLVAALRLARDMALRRREME